MADLISKKYVTPTTSSHAEKILNAPVTHTEVEPQSKEVSLTKTLNLCQQSITDVILLLESLPHVEGKLPEKVILAIGKLNGALTFLRK